MTFVAELCWCLNDHLSISSASSSFTIPSGMVILRNVHSIPQMPLLLFETPWDTDTFKLSSLKHPLEINYIHTSKTDYG